MFSLRNKKHYLYSHYPILHGALVSQKHNTIDSDRDHASPKFSGDVTSPSRRFRAMF